MSMALAGRGYLAHRKIRLTTDQAAGGNKGHPRLVVLTATWRKTPSSEKITTKNNYFSSSWLSSDKDNFEKIVSLIFKSQKIIKTYSKIVKQRHIIKHQYWLSVNTFDMPRPHVVACMTEDDERSQWDNSWHSLSTMFSSFSSFLYYSIHNIFSHTLSTRHDNFSTPKTYRSLGRTIKDTIELIKWSDSTRVMLWWICFSVMSW